MDRSKDSAHYQRLYRQRLREQGLVKKEVWILPGRASELAELEKVLRQPGEALLESGLEALIMQGGGEMEGKVWTIGNLYDALAGAPLFEEGRAVVEMINGEEPCLHIVMSEYGDLPLFLTVMRRYILVEALLWPLSGVVDPDRFHREVLASCKLFPLATIGLEAFPGGEAMYTMYGALSAASSLENVVFEIESLTDNVIKATEAFQEHIVMDRTAGSGQEAS